MRRTRSNGLPSQSHNLTSGTRNYPSAGVKPSPHSHKLEDLTDLFQRIITNQNETVCHKGEIVWN
jgi:hypothetical protein